MRRGRYEPLNHVKTGGQLPLGARAADRVASVVGSWAFIICQSCILAAWMLVNGLAIAFRWDPYPFILLNLMLSFQAAFTGPVILIASNRTDQVRAELAEHDARTDDEAKEVIEAVREINVEQDKKLDRLIDVLGAGQVKHG